MSQSLPETMTVINVPEPGGPEALVPEKRPVPAPATDEVLIRIEAAGVNRPDVIQRQGFYPSPKGAPEWPGLELAGTIVAVGDSVAPSRIGERVMALVPGGAYAEYCTVAASLALPVPSTLSMIEAAALPETFFTVWTNVFQRGALQPGESLLIHGGSSGIGTTGIQIASQLGARVFVTAGSDEKCRACEELGAVKAINYKTEDFVEAIMVANDGKGVDVILDMAGGEYIQKNIDLLNPDGRLVYIAFLQGSKANVNFLPVMLKRLTITGSTLRIRPVEEKLKIANELRERVWPLLEQGTIKPVIHSTFPLEKASEAHALMESSTHVGKIVLTVGN